MVPEDQAPYVCEAQNVFGKVQAETRLVVTGHGSLLDLERRGRGRGRAPQGKPPQPRTHRAPILRDRRVMARFSEEHLEARFLGSVPCDPLGFPFPMRPLGPPDDCPQESSVTRTISSPHSTPTGRQQRLHHPGAGEAAGIPALCHPGRQAAPGEALAQGRSASECRAPACVVGSGAPGRETGAGGTVPFPPWSLLC